MKAHQVQPWEHERARRLHKIFKLIELHRSQGRRLEKLLRWYAARNKGRVYLCDPQRKIKFSFETLRRLYYQWLEGGRSRQALALRYWHRPSILSSGPAIRLARIAIQPGCLSYLAAYRTIENPTRRYSSFFYATPIPLRQKLGDLHRARRRAATLENHAARLVKQLEETSS